jgi:hypothetical protein
MDHVAAHDKARAMAGEKPRGEGNLAKDSLTVRQAFDRYIERKRNLRPFQGRPSRL